MVPFKASEWKPERKVVTRSGLPVRILCTDAKLDTPQLTVGGIFDGGMSCWASNGRFLISCQSPNDLFFADDMEVL